MRMLFFSPFLQWIFSQESVCPISFQRIFCFYFFTGVFKNLLSYFMITCIVLLHFILKYLIPLQLATFIDKKMEAYLSLSFETQEGFVKCDVKREKKKPTVSVWQRFTATFVILLSSTFPGTDSFLVYFTGCCKIFPSEGSIPVVW